MIRATTPTHIFHFPEDPTHFDEILVSYAQFGQKILDKTGTDLTIDTENCNVSVTLTEEETNLFKSKDGRETCEVQVRVRKGNEVSASPIHRIRILPVLNDEVLV